MAWLFLAIKKKIKGIQLDFEQANTDAYKNAKNDIKERLIPDFVSIFTNKKRLFIKSLFDSKNILFSLLISTFLVQKFQIFDNCILLFFFHPLKVFHCIHSKFVCR